MTNDFDSLFAEMLEAYKSGKTVDEVVETQSKNEGLDTTQTSEVFETVQDIDQLSEAYESLKKAKEEGDSREDWLADRMEEITKGLTDDEKSTLINALKDAQVELLNDESDATI